MRPDVEVSVVVPCFNGGGFLDTLLASLASQTFRDFEIIIVDDGSTDPATCARLASLPHDIQVLRQGNRGLSAARNAGIRAARGTFVLPLDCDDTLDPAFLAEVTAVLRQAAPQSAFAFTHMRLVGGADGILSRHCNRFDQLFLNQLPYCMLLRRSAWEAVGGYDETMRDGYEDWEFNIRLTEAGFAGIEIPRPLFIYHVSSEGMLSRSARMHGTIWRRIRSKHAPLYRLPALIARWQGARLPPGKISAVAAAGLLGLSSALPTAWFDAIFHRLLTASRRRRIPGLVQPIGSQATSGLSPGGQ
jgi:glycosyltransferase involved in cell wall biosynthesis